ncbi:hypothetical protein HYFRA_00000046 [Hymenoscyphus fraxineus]|uniref:Methyltransferase type 12 domain-containing protein n=1 Tax=Hymenoscyphus fraxineus TaxID=746836 RepID=A0A9N9PS77_9HELO|nr:hypothetical protein HYFRA_00000046 [Hymenoscyphus fraxineus]
MPPIKNHIIPVDKEGKQILLPISRTLKMASSARPIQSVSTLDLYNRWAQVYDTDGNILQAIDDLLIPDLLTQAFQILSSDGPDTKTPTPITITELGCGTGRNTLKLLHPSLPIPIHTINALDLSPAMLTKATQRTTSFLSSLPEDHSKPSLNFQGFNALSPPPSLLNDLKAKADLVLSTLVLEHIPLSLFFRTCRGFLKPGGVLVMSNMHAEMGKRSQAGFLSEEGIKVQGESFVYEVEEVVGVAREEGFNILGEVKERGVEEGDLGGVVGERGGKWMGVRVWFGGVFRLGGVGMGC